MILLGVALKGARVLRQRYPHGGHDQGQTSSGPIWSNLVHFECSLNNRCHADFIDL